MRAPSAFTAAAVCVFALAACTSHAPGEPSATGRASTTQAPAPSGTDDVTGPTSSAAPRAGARTVQEGMTLGGRAALVEGPASAPPTHTPRVVAHGIAIEEGPLTPLPPRNLKAVSPGKVEDAKIAGTYAMQLPADQGAPAQWLRMLLVEGLPDPPATFFGIEGATEVVWKSPIPSPARELVSCVGFDGLVAVVEVHGNKEARFVVGGRYVGATTSTEVSGAFVVDGAVYLWLTRDGRAELIDLAAGVARRAPEPPRRLEGMPGTPRCPMR